MNVTISLGAKLFSNVAEVVLLSSDNALDFQPKMLSIKPVNVLKDLKYWWKY